MKVTYKIRNIIPAQFYFIPEYDEEPEDNDTSDDTVSSEEDTHSDDWGDTESQEEKGFDDDERD